LHRQACAPACLHACDAWHGYSCAHTWEATQRCTVPSGLNEGAAVGMRVGARVVGKRVGALVVGMATGATVIGATVGVAANRTRISCWHMGRMGGGARRMSGGVGARTWRWCFEEAPGLGSIGSNPGRRRLRLRFCCTNRTVHSLLPASPEHRCAWTAVYLPQVGKTMLFRDRRPQTGPPSAYCGCPMHAQRGARQQCPISTPAVGGVPTAPLACPHSRSRAQAGRPCASNHVFLALRWGILEYPHSTP
jgi:hypothetical protein